MGASKVCSEHCSAIALVTSSISQETERADQSTGKLAVENISHLKHSQQNNSMYRQFQPGPSWILGNDLVLEFFCVFVVFPLNKLVPVDGKDYLTQLCTFLSFFHYIVHSLREK